MRGVVMDGMGEWETSDVTGKYQELAVIREDHDG